MRTLTNNRRPTRICEQVHSVVWLLSFAVQLVAAPMFILWTAGWAGEFLRTLAQPYRPLDSPVKFLQTLMPDFVGFLTGFLVRSLPGPFREPARWIWVVPAILAAVMITASTFTDLDPLWIKLFGMRGHDYAGSGVAGLLFPLGAVFLYSMGIRSGDKHTNPLEGAEKNYDGPQSY